MENKWKLIAIISIILLILISLYFLYNYIFTLGFNQGFQQGATQQYNSLIFKINNEGVIPVLTNQNNETQVDWINIREVCGG